MEWLPQELQRCVSPAVCQVQKLHGSSQKLFLRCNLELCPLLQESQARGVVKMVAADAERTRLVALCVERGRFLRPVLALLHPLALNHAKVRAKPLKEPIERKEFEFSPPAPITRVVNSTQALPEVRLVALDQA
jgi:hypothetical protein